MKIECVNDLEARRAASAIAGFLGAAGWTIDTALQLRDDIEDGVTIYSYSMMAARMAQHMNQPGAPAGDIRAVSEVARASRDTAQAVVEMLEGFGWTGISIEDPFGKPDLRVGEKALVVHVGLKPSPVGDEAEERAAMR